MYIPAGDDEHSWRFNLNLKPSPGGRVEEERFWGPDYRKMRNLSNHYLQDREQQRIVNYTGTGSNFVVHDSCATETMGPIYDRSKEHLGVSDRAVIAVRNYLLRTARAFASGAEPPNIVTDAARNEYRHVDTFSLLIEGRDWRGAFPHLTLRREDAGDAIGLPT